MKIALDIGNSAVKGSILDNKNKLIDGLNLPSAVSIISDSKYLTYHNDDIYIQVIQSPLSHYDEIVAVGQAAVDRPGYQEFDVTSTSYKANHQITTSLLFGSIAPYIEKNTEAKLAVSVPIVEAKSLGLTEDYQNLLTGKHIIRIYRDQDYKDIEIEFTIVRVLNEGQAGFLGLLDQQDKDFQAALMSVYNHLGEEENPLADLEDFLIVDIGEGTTDLAVFRNKRFNAEYSYSVTAGYGNLLEDAMAKAQRENLTIESRKELQRVLESTNKRRKERRELWESYVEPTKAHFVKQVTDTILNAYGTRDYFDAIIFLGGGFSALTHYRVEFGQVKEDDNILFETLREKLEKNHKQVDLLFGVPSPYSSRINERGLVQILTTL